jgi:hypothetical protein
MKKTVLNLGSEWKRNPEEFCVDFNEFIPVDLYWNLDKQLPNSFNGKWKRVKAISVLEHLGNPQLFLDGCYKYLKKDGILELQTDNACYWGWHFEHLGIIRYHASCWEFKSKKDEINHKMLFQKQHLERLLRLAGFKNSKVEYGGCVNALDSLFGKKFGSLYLKVEVKK